jgi:predicted acetyltransferase
LTDDEAGLYTDLVTARAHTPVEYYLSHYDGLDGGWDNSRVVLVDGRIASHVRVYNRTVRWGGSSIQCGGMADVYTCPGDRRKGYARDLLRDSLGVYHEWGCGFSHIISGVVEFYASEHWERWPTYRFDLAVQPERLPKVTDYRVRRFNRSADLEAVAGIYEAYNRDSPMTLVRDANYWSKHFSWCRKEREEAFYVAELDGDIVGYMRADTSTIWETAYSPGHEMAAVALLDAEMRLMRSRGTKRCGVYLPCHEPLLFIIRTLRYTTTLVETNLLRIVDLEQMLQTLAPGFARQLAECDHAIPPLGSVALTSCGQTVCITSGPGGVTISPEIPEGTVDVSLPQRDLFNLMTGSDTHVHIAAPKATRDLLEVLFPKRNPMWWPIDTV